jgi:hypothetical protein
MSRQALMSILMFASILVLSAGTAVASSATGLWSTADDGQVQISDCAARLCGRLVTSNDQTTIAMGAVRPVPAVDSSLSTKCLLGNLSGDDRLVFGRGRELFHKRE